MSRRKKAGELRSNEINCKHCGAIIQEDALSCPSCGRVFEALKLMVVFAVVMIIVIAGMSYLVYSLYFTEHEAGWNQIDDIDDGDDTTTPTGKTIVFELKEADAPGTCANFKKYVNDRFFDGLIFHRVIDNFMIQGGGFTTDLTQKTATYDPIALEISPNLRHIDGAVAMARTNDPNSATSQFYICDGVQSSLDDSYAVFGQVTSGMEHVRAISAVATTTEGGMSDVPVSDVIIQSARLSNTGGKTFVTLTVTY